MKESLYHFFPKRSQEFSPLYVLQSIFENGIYLSTEKDSVPWKDFYGKRKDRELTYKQYRFCLTAISNREELINHSLTFGRVGLEFSSSFITKLGGFPVFYVPAPTLESHDKEDYIGISLLYRIGEIQEILEYIIKEKILFTPDIDLENALGAIKFLGNICYPTHGSGSNDESTNFYHEREWRIIYGLTPETVDVEKHEGIYTIKTYCKEPIHRFIKKIIIVNTDQGIANPTELADEIRQILELYKHQIDVEILV